MHHQNIPNINTRQSTPPIPHAPKIINHTKPYNRTPPLTEGGKGQNNTTPLPSRMIADLPRSDLQKQFAQLGGAGAGACHKRSDFISRPCDPVFHSLSIPERPPHDICRRYYIRTECIFERVAYLGSGEVEWNLDGSPI